MKFNRQTALKASAGLFALPNLFAAEMPAPTRAVFIAMGFGVNAFWFPKPEQNNLSLTPSLEPLEKHRKDFSLIQNLSLKQKFNPHYGSYIYLTGENIYRVPGAIQNSVSCDQILARDIGFHCRFPSLSISSELATDGYGHGKGVSSLSVDWSGRYIPGIRGPLRLYKTIFGITKASPEEIKNNLLNKRSHLDLFTHDLKRAQKTFDHSSGKPILEEYTDSIRDLENRLAHAMKWSDIPFPKTNYKEPKADFKASEEVKLTYEIMTLALKFDLTRVITYKLPTESILLEMGAPINVHAMSHQEQGETALARDLKNSQFFDHFLNKLKAEKTPDGKDLLHHSLISYGAGLRHGHGTRNVPSIIAGHASGKLKQGQNIIKSSSSTDICDLWYTILKTFNPETKSFKTGHEIIKELLV